MGPFPPHWVGGLTRQFCHNSASILPLGKCGLRCISAISANMCRWRAFSPPLCVVQLTVTVEVETPVALSAFHSHMTVTSTPHLPNWQPEENHEDCCAGHGGRGSQGGNTSTAPTGGTPTTHTTHPKGLAAIPPHMIFQALETFLRLFLPVPCDCLDKCCLFLCVALRGIYEEMS